MAGFEPKPSEQQACQRTSVLNVLLRKLKAAIDDVIMSKQCGPEVSERCQ